MTIQIPNPGTGNGQTGDNEFLLWSKVKGNFENSTHAASRLVGTTADCVPVFTNVGVSDTGLASKTVKQLTNIQFEDPSVALGSGIYRVAGDVAESLRYSTVLQMGYADSYASQIIIKQNSASIEMFVRNTLSSSLSKYNYGRLYHSADPVIFNATTASGANVVINSSGTLMRSTSSERYKDILSDLELDDEAYKNAMQLAPIVYRSTAEADNPDYHYYSFSAEALGAFDPAFTLWRDTETVTDAEGNTTEQPLAERVAEGININALLAFSHAIAIKQDKMIKMQADAIATLTQRLDAMATQ